MIEREWKLTILKPALRDKTEHVVKGGNQADVEERFMETLVIANEFEKDLCYVLFVRVRKACAVRHTADLLSPMQLVPTK